MKMAFSRPFQWYTTSPKFQKFQLVRPKKQLQWFSDCRAYWSKNCNGKSTTVLFQNVYHECIEGKLGMCLLLVMYIDDDWMVNMMIIYINWKDHCQNFGY
jgi:hypothetical protein